MQARAWSFQEQEESTTSCGRNGYLYHSGRYKSLYKEPFSASVHSPLFGSTSDPCKLAPNQLPTTTDSPTSYSIFVITISSINLLLLLIQISLFARHRLQPIVYLGMQIAKCSLWLFDMILYGVLRVISTTGRTYGSRSQPVVDWVLFLSISMQ